MYRSDFINLDRLHCIIFYCCRTKFYYVWCFFPYVVSPGEWNANITFVGNRAKGSIPAGHAIYASSLHPCQVVNNGTEKQPHYRLMKTSDVFTM